MRLERLTLKLAGKVLFLFILGAFIFVGLASDLMFVVAIASVAVFLWAVVIFPADQFKKTGKYLWSGRAGEDAHGLWCKLIPWRGGGR